MNIKSSSFANNIPFEGRVTKTTKGGRKLSFRSLSISGNYLDGTGIGIGKSSSIHNARSRAKSRARKNFVPFPKNENGSIDNTIVVKRGNVTILLKPKPKGGGITASPSLIPFLEMAGYKDISVNIIGRLKPIKCFQIMREIFPKIRNNKKIRSMTQSQRKNTITLDLTVPKNKKI